MLSAKSTAASEWLRPLDRYRKIVLPGQWRPRAQIHKASFWLSSSVTGPEIQAKIGPVSLPNHRTAAAAVRGCHCRRVLILLVDHSGNTTVAFHQPPSATFIL